MGFGVVFYVQFVLNVGGCGRGLGQEGFHGNLKKLAGNSFSVGGEFAGNAMENELPSRTIVGRAPRQSGRPMQWPTIPSTPPPFPDAHRILLEWGHQQGARGHKLEVLCALLRSEYLVRLPLPRGCKGCGNRESLEPRQLRYLFRRQAAKVLGWRNRIEEGAANGFSAPLNRAIREEVYPDL